MSSRRVPATGVNHPAERALKRRRVDPKTLKTKSDAPAAVAAPDEVQPDYDFQAAALDAAAVLSRPLSKQDLRRMAMNLVRFAEIKEIASGKRSRPKQGKTLRDAVHAAEERIKTSRKSQRESLDAYAAGDAVLEWVDHSYIGPDGKEIIHASYAIASPEPEMPSAEEAGQRIMQNLERERGEHPERFLDESDFAALQESLMPAASSDRPKPTDPELAAIISEEKYRIRGEDFDDINAARKVAKVKKQTAKRVREHRARKKAEKPADGEP